MTIDHSYDAIVIGGGPAGATTAALLAEHGRRVLVLEKDKFPRYHIGESLIPYCYFTLDRLGLVDKLNASHFPRKYSVQFVRPDGHVSAPFYFFEHYDHPSSTSWQVLRSEFDLMLLNNARDQGAEVREETRVRQTITENGAVVGVRAVDKGGREWEFRAPITVDASGRDALTMSRNEWRIREPMLNKISLWTYFRGVKRDTGYDEGATTIAYLPEKAWFWWIPLPDQTASVGIVAERDYLYPDTRDPETIFFREAEKNAWIKDHLEPGEQFGRFYATSDFSYRSQHCAADGLVLTGDAFAFLDPVFSSGVFLALKGGELAADAVHEALDAGDVGAARFENYGNQVRQGLEAMRKLVYAFYDHNFSFGDLMMKHPDVRGDLTDCLIGNVFRDFDKLFDAVSEFAHLPEEPSYGGPLVTPACASSS